MPFIVFSRHNVLMVTFFSSHTVGRLGVPTGLHRPRGVEATERPGGGLGAGCAGPETSQSRHAGADRRQRPENRFARVWRLLLRRLFKTFFQ